MPSEIVKAPYHGMALHDAAHEDMPRAHVYTHV